MAKESSKNRLHPSKPKKQSKKAQKTKDVRTGAMGIGDAYAYGVKGLVEKMKSEQGSSQTHWLGVEKISLDVTEYVDRQELKTKGKE